MLSNAFNFTEKGGVTLTIARPAHNTRFSRDSLRDTPKIVAFIVSDTGIGISPEKHQTIFEAFQQADGTTNRRYGGTGLGLSISREITRLLGGEIHIASLPGKGSSFTLYLPETYAGPEMTTDDVAGSSRYAPPMDLGAALPGLDAIVSRPVEDDREHIREGDRVLLIIEDDVKFARIMVSMARERGFKTLVANRGDVGLAMANELLPDAITLDIQLPVLDGWTVLDRLKRNPRTRHIPVHVISINERTQRGFGLGAFAYLEKPVSKEALEGAFAHMSSFLDRSVRVLLIVEDNEHERGQMQELLGEGDDIDVTSVGTAEEALAALASRPFDCMVVDLVLPGKDGFRLIEEVKGQPQYRDLPIVVYTGKDLTDAEEIHIKKYAHSVVTKTGAHSAERLVQDTSLFLHRIDSKKPDRAKPVLRDSAERQASLRGKTVLVVDDDIRNIFAMSSILENRGLKVLYAENGKAGIEMLEANPEIDVVLMDVMMPEMDGYETTRVIRANPAYRSLPIIAVTAKALKEDRDKCMAAGASDYLPKPVDVEKLVELLGMWATPE